VKRRKKVKKKVGSTIPLISFKNQRLDVTIVQPMPSLLQNIYPRLLSAIPEVISVTTDLTTPWSDNKFMITTQVACGIQI